MTNGGASGRANEARHLELVLAVGHGLEMRQVGVRVHWGRELRRVAGNHVHGLHHRHGREVGIALRGVCGRIGARGRGRGRQSGSCIWDG